MVDLGEQAPDIHYFRVTFDLGQAVDTHRRELARAWGLHGTGSRQLLDFMIEKSRRWLDSHTALLESLSYDSHIALVRGKIEADKDLTHPDLQCAYQKVADTLAATEPKELLSCLHAACKDAYDHADTCLRTFGGGATSSRWAAREAAALKIASRRYLTMCTFETADCLGGFDAVALHIGSPGDAATSRIKGALRTYYCFPFFFLHEYVSHSFAYWQEPQFVDGYLVWAARQMTAKISHDHLRDRFVQDTFHNIQQREDQHTLLQDSESIADWFAHVTSVERFLFFLLEWGGTEPSGDFDAAVLAALKLLADQVSDARHVESLRATLAESDFARAGSGVCRLAGTLGQYPQNYSPKL